MADRHSFKSQMKALGAFVSFTYPQARKKTWAALALLVLTGLTEGASLVLLVPILGLLTPGADVISVTLPSVLASIAGVSVLTLNLAAVLAGFVCVVILQALLSRLGSLVMVDAVLTVTDRLRLTLFGSIALARWEYLVGVRHSDLNHAITSDIERVQVVLNCMLLLVQSLIMLAVYAAVSVLISPAMTLLACAIGAVFILILHPIRRYAAQYGERVTAQRQEQYRTVSEFLAGLKLVKSLNTEPRYLRSFWRNAEEISREIRRYFRVSAAPTFIFQVLSAVSAAMLVYVAVRVLSMPLERIAILLFVFMRIAPRFTSIQTNIQQALLNIGGYGSVRALIVKARSEQETRGRSGPPLRLQEALTLEAVDFAYREGRGSALKGVSLTIPARRVTAIIGPSGGGKSTLADLMMGLIEPQSGQVTVDGVPMSDANRRSWRGRVAYVPQEVFLTHDTIASNLRLANAKADEAALWRVLSQANAASFVEALPDGIHTIVGDRGTRLSGGERQRIALARALLRQPELLILDEATSALDWENQKLIAEAIERLRGDVTVVTIAHRPSMIAFADEVIAIEDGEVVESGPFNEVLGRLDSRLSRMVAGERPSGLVTSA